MRKPIIALLLLALLAGPALGQSNSGLSTRKSHRVFLHLTEGTHLDLPQLQEMGVRIVSVRPDPSGEAKAVVEALVNEQMMGVLKASGAMQEMPAPDPDAER